MRLFIAIEIPTEHKRELGRLQAEITGARRVPLEQIHLTLAFLGEVDEETAGKLGNALAQLQAEAFELAFAGTGCFPDRRRPRVVWVGLKAEPALQKLAAAVSATLLACGITLEDRHFSPHITLARLKSPVSTDLRAFFVRHSSVKLKPFAVTSFTLFQSTLLRQGAEHLPLRSFSLSTAGGDVRR